MRQPIIEVKDVTFGYHQQAVLEKIHFTLRSGDYAVLIGPNGSGKSTLVKLMLGLLSIQEGEIVRSFDSETPQPIGYVSQRASRVPIDFPATVREVVTSGLSGSLGLFRWPEKRERNQVTQAIEQVGLTDVADRHIGRLSGGQQQRAFIARALVGQPQLLILDEPTVGVDIQVKNQFYQLLVQLHQARKGMTILLVTHELEEVIEQADRFLCLNRRLYFEGGREQFLQRQAEILPALFGVPQVGVSG
jgi:zinc transport system ATP-binding protein